MILEPDVEYSFLHMNKFIFEYAPASSLYTSTRKASFEPGMCIATLWSGKEHIIIQDTRVPNELWLC